MALCNSRRDTVRKLRAQPHAQLRKRRDKTGIEARTDLMRGREQDPSVTRSNAGKIHASKIRRHHADESQVLRIDLDLSAEPITTTFKAVAPEALADNNHPARISRTIV